MTKEEITNILGYLPQTGDKSYIDAVSKKLSGNLGVKTAVIKYLAAQGIPASALKAAPINSLSLAYNIPNYLRSWRNRINPQWALLGGDDDIAELDVDNFGKVNAEEVKTSPAPVAAPDSAKALRDMYAQIELSVTKLIKQKADESVIKLDPAAKEQIRQIAQDAAKAYAEANAAPRTIEILNPLTTERINLGLQHETFPTLLRACQARDHRGYRLNVWLTGPTGSGKTTAGENVAKALNLPFGSDGSLDADYKVLGFRDANGNIISTQFLRIYEHGGLYLADEIDNWLPSALLSLNAALANGFVSTPGGLITRHKDCIVVACANTWGHGATNEYVGRTKQDAATLDRFQPKIHWPIDEKLEMALADTQAADIGRAWATITQTARTAVAKQGLKVIISPRATFSGIALLLAGFTRDEVVNMTIGAGLSPEQKSVITRAIAHIAMPSDALNVEPETDINPEEKETYSNKASLALSEIRKAYNDIVKDTFGSVEVIPQSFYDDRTLTLGNK